jgi:hypothetical protein
MTVCLIIRVAVVITKPKYSFIRLIAWLAWLTCTIFILFHSCECPIRRWFRYTRSKPSSIDFSDLLLFRSVLGLWQYLPVERQDSWRPHRAHIASTAWWDPWWPFKRTRDTSRLILQTFAYEIDTDIVKLERFHVHWSNEELQRTLKTLWPNKNPSFGSPNQPVRVDDAIHKLDSWQTDWDKKVG